MVAISDLSVMLFPWGAKNPQVSEIGAAGDKWQRDPRLGAFTFVYVAEKEADFQTMLPRLRDSVAFVDPNTDAMGVTVSGSPEHLAALDRAGVDHFVLEFQFHGLETVAFGMERMKIFAQEVVPLL